MPLAVRRRTDDGRAGRIHRACGDLGRPAVRRALHAPRQFQTHVRTQREVQNAVLAGRNDHRAPARRRHAVDALLDRGRRVGAPRRVRPRLGHNRPYRAVSDLDPTRHGRMALLHGRRRRRRSVRQNGYRVAFWRFVVVGHFSSDLLPRHLQDAALERDFPGAVFKRDIRETEFNGLLHAVDVPHAEDVAVENVGDVARKAM